MENEIHEQRDCLYCGEPLIGRQDKFCSVKHKNAFNNRENRKKNSIYKHVDKQLHQNHKVLQKYYPDSEGKDFLNQRPMLMEGFNPSYYVRIVPLKESGEKVFVLYNYGFVINEKQQIKILKNNE